MRCGYYFKRPRFEDMHFYLFIQFVFIAEKEHRSFSSQYENIHSNIFIGSAAILIVRLSKNLSGLTVFPHELFSRMFCNKSSNIMVLSYLYKIMVLSYLKAKYNLLEHGFSLGFVLSLFYLFFYL